MKSAEKQKGGARPGAGRKKGGHNRDSKRARDLALREQLQRDLALTAQVSLEQIRRGALYDVRVLFDEAGNFKPMHELSEREAAMIAGIDVVKRNVASGDGHTDTVLKVRLVDRAKYVEMAAKHHGLLTEKIEHSGGLVVRWQE